MHGVFIKMHHKYKQDFFEIRPKKRKIWATFHDSCAKKFGFNLLKYAVGGTIISNLRGHNVIMSLVFISLISSVHLYSFC